MLKLVVLAPWILLLVPAHSAPMLVQQPLRFHSQDAGDTAHQNDREPISLANISNTEAPLLGLLVSPLTREDFEKLQRYASDLEGEAITIKASEGGESRKVADSWLHSIVHDVVESWYKTLAKVPSVWSIKSDQDLTSFSHLVHGEGETIWDDNTGVEEPYEDDANYSMDDLKPNPFIDTEGMARFDDALRRFIRSSTHSDSLEPLEHEHQSHT